MAGTPGQGNILSGFIEGSLLDGTTYLPFSDKIGEVTFNYASTNLISETFSSQGIKGASNACPVMEECSIEMMSENLAWSFLQAATNTLATNSDRATEFNVSVVLSTVAGTPAVSTYVLTGITAAVVGSIRAANEDGVEYDVTATVAGGNTTVTFDEDYTGDKVTIFYTVAASGTNNLLKLGAGTKLKEVGIYGRFFGCPDSYIITIPRAIIQANLSLKADGSNAGSASLTATALRDNFGSFAYLLRV